MLLASKKTSSVVKAVSVHGLPWKMTVDATEGIRQYNDMSTTNARFSGQCPKCGRAIRPGDPIECSPGSKAQHVDCTTIPKRRRGKAGRGKTAPAEFRALPQGDVELLLSRRRAVGEIIHSRQYATGGGPGGYYWRLTHVYKVGDEWLAHATAATDAEAMPLVQLHVANNIRETHKAALRAIVNGKHPAPVIVYEPTAISFSYESSCVLDGIKYHVTRTQIIACDKAGRVYKTERTEALAEAVTVLP